MGVETVFPPGPTEVAWGQRGGSHFVTTSGPRRSNLPPIINLHAQPGPESWQTVLGSQQAGLMHSTIRVGYRQCAPFTGRNWGHQSNISPAGTGGTGLTSIDDAVVALGDPPKVNLMGISMGALNALRWAWLHPDRVNAVSIYAPAWDLVHLWDSNTSDFRASLNAVYGTADRASFIAATAAHDPARNAAAIAAIPAPVAAFIAMDDVVVGTTGVEAWAAAAGVDLTTTPTGGHIAWILGPEFDELDALRTFTTT